jgi:hypothetical protein
MDILRYCVAEKGVHSLGVVQDGWKRVVVLGLL